MPHPSSRGDWLWAAIVTAAATACFIILSLQPVQAQTRDAANDARARSESPYFFVRGADPGVDALPLKATDVDVRIAGVIAEVTVLQHYRNEGTRAIEASYVFPGSTRAAVSGLQVRLADRVVSAKIREKQQARIEYDAAKREGRTAALLEQHRPNVFQMRVANILPGDDVRVELRYTELLVPESGNYQFVFPTIVGPRYVSPSQPVGGAEAQASSGSPAWTAQPTLRAGVAPTSRFTLEATLDTPLGIQEIRSRTHALALRQDTPGGTHAELRIADGERAANDRDFILDYRLAGDAVAAGLLLQRGAGDGAENFFLALVEPPKSVAATAISPRDYIFVVDISGSMHGFPLDTATQMLERLIGGLRPSDTFNVLLFAGSNRMLAPHSVPATQANIQQAVATIKRQQGGGGTELIPALRRVYAEPKAADVSRTVVVVTDGYVTVEDEAFALVRGNLDKANLFAFGIGSSVNRALIEGLARAGMGEAFVITDPVQAPEQAVRFRRMVESPVLTAVKARFEGLDVYDVEPRVLPDVLAERPVVVFGKWRGEARGTLVVEGQGAGGPFRQAMPVNAHDVAEGGSGPLRALWARHRIAALSDQEALQGNGAQKADITALGLKYGLLTAYTSFIAVDDIVRNAAPANALSVAQPLPLPQGVGEGAVGGGAQNNIVAGAAVPSTPEPETWGAMALVVSMLWMLHRRARRAQRRHFTS